MKKGINSYVFPKEWTKSFALDSAKNVGYEGIEFMIDEKEDEGFLNFKSTNAEAKELSRECKELDLDIPSLSTIFHNVYSLTSEDAKIRQRGEDIALKMIELAVEMESKVIQIVPGVATPDVAYDHAYELAQKSLDRLAQEASKAGVILGIENVNTKFLPSPMEFSRFLNEINHPNVKAYFNVGNAMETGCAEHWIPMLNDKIIAIHAKDYIQTKKEFAPALEGDANWSGLIELLNNYKYTEYIMSVLPTSYTGYWDNPVEMTYHNLNKILKL